MLAGKSFLSASKRWTLALPIEMTAGTLCEPLVFVFLFEYWALEVERLPVPSRPGPSTPFYVGLPDCATVWVGRADGHRSCHGLVVARNPSVRNVCQFPIQNDVFDFMKPSSMTLMRFVWFVCSTVPYIAIEFQFLQKSQLCIHSTSCTTTKYREAKVEVHQPLCLPSHTSQQLPTFSSATQGRKNPSIIIIIDLTGNSPCIFFVLSGDGLCRLAHRQGRSRVETTDKQQQQQQFL